MKKSDELKNKLIEIYNNKQWDKIIDVNGDKFIYISATNEFRKIINQPSGDIAAIVATMTMGKFFTWCC